MSESLLQKQEEIKKLFQACSSAEERYLRIIELGKGLPAFPQGERKEENLVAGCQSQLYLHTELKNDKIFFSCASEALISAGLAALLVRLYSGEEPTVLIQSPPHFLQELGIFASLSPGRSNGLASLFLRMQQEAIKVLSLRK